MTTVLQTNQRLQILPDVLKMSQQFTDRQRDVRQTDERKTEVRQTDSRKCGLNSAAFTT